jgi:peroxiredoxin
VRHIFFITILLANTVTALAQQPALKEILHKVNMAVENTPAGQYTLTEDYKRVAPSKPPVHAGSVTTCYFKTNHKDTVIGYKLSAIRKDNSFHKIYNGTVVMEKNNKVVTVTYARKNPEEIRRLFSDDALFPFMTSANIFLQKYSADSLIHKIQLLPDEVVNGEKCWKLMPQVDAGNKKKVIAAYYISRSSLLPVKTVIEWREAVGNVTETTVFTHTIDQLKKENVPDSVFTIAAMNDYRQVRQFTGQALNAPLLSTGTPAPAWKLPSKGKDSIALADYKGKIVVMDFWYKACVPCYQQMLDMQQLKEQVNRPDVVFIGVNGIDDPVTAQLDQFLAGRKLDMVSAYHGKTIAADYKISGYPVLYVIGKDGKVLFAQDGYSNTLKADLLQLLGKQ